MSTCRWCTQSGADTTEFLKRYAAQRLSQEDFEGSNDDLCYCLECVVEYHKAREECPRLHEDLWNLETSRLVAHMEKSMNEETGEDELFLVDEHGETPLSGYVGPNFENNLRVPLLEILKYPYLLLHEKVSELCVEVLCRMERSQDSFQVFEKYPGIYLFLVHPNEAIRRWAILTARNLGKVDRDDYYDLEEVLTCLFRVIELGLFENPDIYSSSMFEKGKLILLPAHLYDTANYKNYWLGICMLLSVLEEQAMDSLLLGPDKQNDFMQSILHTMEKEAADDSTDPFWPALHCFMVILDQLGSKVWGQLIDPVQAFQTIINSVSYNNEIKNIRSSFMRTKAEPDSDYGDDMMSCSQIVYNYNTEKPQKDTGWKAAICPEYCPNMYEDMQTLANMLQSDIGRDMRVHHSTFLWFIPFVQSLMDLKDLGVAYIVEVIHYLCSEIKDILIERFQECDKISEFFLLILVSIVELHRSKKCLHLLWISSQEWVEAVVRCATLPSRAFTRCSERAPGLFAKGSAASSLQGPSSVQHACVQLIRSLLKEGYQIGQHALCKQYLDKLNLLLRGNRAVGWQLSSQETQELQMCLKQVIRSIKGKALSTSLAGGSSSSSTALPSVSTKQERNVLMTSQIRSLSSHRTLWQQKYVGKVQENRSSDLVAGKCNMDDQCFSSNTEHSDFRRGRELEVKHRAESKTPPCLSAQTHLDSPSSRSCKSMQETSANSVFQSRLVPTKQESKEASLDSSNFSRNEAGLQGKEDDSTLLLGRDDTSLKKHESSDRLFEFSEYFRRENSSVGKKEENFVKTVSEDDDLSDSQVDRELSKLSLAAYAKSLNFPIASNQESSVYHNVSCDIKRKVKGSVRSSSEGQSTKCPSGGDRPSNQVIVISDSSDEEKGVAEKEEAKTKNENVCAEPSSTSSSTSDTDPKREPKSPGSPLLLDDCESQYFEFETEDEVFSAWQDTQNDNLNEWGYDLPYFSDDSMEVVASSIGKQTEDTSYQKEADDTKEATNSTLEESVGKEEAKGQLEKCADKDTAKGFTLDSKVPEPTASTSPISLASKLALKKKSTSPQKITAKCKSALAVQRSPKKPPVVKTAKNKTPLQSTTERSQPGRSMPAVVPPRKVRQSPAPASTAEKLGLKKGPRKAFDLSQPSLESLALLRSHGKAAGRIGVTQKKRTKQIEAQRLSVIGNKKLLACQDRQYLRPKRSVKKFAGSLESRNKVTKTSAKPVEQKPQSFELAAIKESVENQREKKREEAACPSASERKFESLSVEEVANSSKMPRSSDWNAKWEGNSVVVPPVPMDSSLSSAVLEGDKDESSGKGCTVLPECEMKTSKQNGCKSDESSDEGDDNLFLTQLDPVDMELCSQEESVQDAAIGSKSPEEMDVDESLQQNELSAVAKCEDKDCMEQVEKPGEYCSKHAATSAGADHVFAKPSCPPPKAQKPSTTKIFSSASSSRNAAFSKDLEDVRKFPPPSKSKVNAAKLAVVRPPLYPKPAPAGNPTSKSPSFQPLSSSNVLQSQNKHYDNASNITRRPGRETSSSFLGQQRDYSIFVNQVLKWTYEMFENFIYFGTPNHLLQTIVAAVPPHFQGYNEYFDTFFPLMMLNAFETVSSFLLFGLVSSTLRNFTKRLKPGLCPLFTFENIQIEIRIEEQFGVDNPNINDLDRQKEQQTACRLTVQTQGNLSFFIHKQVKCVVVGSLVTTHRKFKGLLLLSRSPLVRPIINPSYNDFCPRDLPVASGSAVSYMNEYNEDQKRAIETAYAMVKQHPGLPKICLIHGPPGTGKSKTIVGLLSRVLRENTRNEKTARKKNSKIKPNRFLVCAPSNAAVDELMKKIIIAFKEKCQNKQEPLGNCGDIKLVRLGPEKSINNEVRGFSLDKQVEHRMKRKPGDCDQDIQKKKEALDQKLDMLSRERAMHRCEKREVARQFLILFVGVLLCLKVRVHSQKVQADIILESDIICCTLSTSGGSLLESAFSRQGLDRFSCVIVDEAGQSCEVETLIPLIHRCNKLVLVGDPKQLPPTVKSVKAQQYGYDQSLMARLQKHLEEQVQRNMLHSLPVVQLTVQYRMHPDICLFPSKYVYGRTLKTAKAIEENRCSSEWPFQPYLIFDVADGREERDNDSYSNPREVKLVMELIRTIKEKRKDLGLRRIGIITPYSAQKKKIQEQLDSVFKNNSPGEVDTVDAFQGREKDCIIVSCVRANSFKGSIGYVAAGISSPISRDTGDENWNHLIQDAQKRGAIIRATEKNYKKEALRILKLRPPAQPPPKGGTMTSPVVQAASSSGKRSEPGNSGNSPRELAAGPGHAVPQGSRGPTQPAGTAAADSNRGSAPAPLGAAAADSNRGSAPAPLGAPAADSRRSSAPAPLGAPAADSRRSSAPAPMGAPAADSRRSSAPAPLGAPAADSRRSVPLHPWGLQLQTPGGQCPAPMGAPAADSRRSSAPAPLGAPAADSRRAVPLPHGGSSCSGGQCPCTLGGSSCRLQEEQQCLCTLRDPICRFQEEQQCPCTLRGCSTWCRSREAPGPQAGQPGQSS
uniref:Uncharacterized protein n=1 Tax=Geospiza parvula TaxID=87175 RepID=A0A8C3Q8G5_GEOPR